MSISVKAKIEQSRVRTFRQFNALNVNARKLVPSETNRTQSIDAGMSFQSLDRQQSLILDNSVQKLNAGSFVNGIEKDQLAADIMDPGGLQHASSLEAHIISKIKNKIKVEESFFEYEKNLKFQNPLTLF